MKAQDVPVGKIFRIRRTGKVYKMLSSGGPYYVEAEESKDALRTHLIPAYENVEVKGGTDES